MNLLDLLAGSDRRSIGRADEVAERIFKHPGEFSAVFDGLTHANEIIRMRAADVVEKVSRKHPELLQPYKGRILKEVSAVKQQEVQWHVAQLIPRLNLTPSEKRQAITILLAYCGMKSRILRTFALQGLFSIAANDPRVKQMAQDFAKTGSPAMRSRAQKILAQLKQGLRTPLSKS